MRRLLSVAAVVVVTTCAGAETAPVQKPSTSAPAPKVAGIFSDLHWVEEAGDLVGTEVFLFHGRAGYWALLQLAEGAPRDPSLVSATVSGTAVEFPFPAFGPKAVFKGLVTATRLEGAITGGSAPVKLSLPRRGSYWQ
jgi:hypothetical protein